MNILITGVHGFVGTNLVNFLKERHTIYGMDIVSPAKDGVKATFSWESLSEPKSLPEFDAIIHLAGKAHDLKKTAQPEVYFQVNTELTKRIYDYFLASGARKFVFFSSVKAAADFVPGEILTEDIVPHPVGPYGESKIAAEQYILANMPVQDCSRVQNGSKLQETTLNAEGIEQPETTLNKKSVYILRPCMIHGPGNKGNLNLLYGVVKKGIPWPLGAFENRRSFTSVDNLTFVIQELLQGDAESGIYNMGDDEALSTNELIGVMCKAMGKKAHIWKLPKGLMNGVAKCGDVLHLPMNSERITKLTENYVVSNEKIKKAIGIEKMPYSAEEGLVKTVRSFGL